MCYRNLFGLDIDTNLVRTCQMNLVLHGDGSSNVYRVDSTRSPGEWDEDARRDVPFGEIDILITNPPFGGNARIDDAHVLSQYELPGWERKERLASMPSEQLFVEAALRFIKPAGYLIIVLPNGILNNPSLRFIRSWILHRARIIASVHLPKSTFSASRGVNNSSVIILQRFKDSEIMDLPKRVKEDSYNVFFAAPKTSGIAGSGRKLKPLFLRHPDGREVLNEDGEKVRDDEIVKVAARFQKWLET